MSDNKKYYYLKLKENYFDQDHIKVIESYDNGHTYSLILIKIYLKALKGDGCLYIYEDIPYDPKQIDILAKVIGHDPDHVSKALSLGTSLGIVEVMDQAEIWVKDFQNLIGHGSSEAERKKLYRAKLEQKRALIEDKKEMGHCPTDVPDNGDKRPPELELELELEKEIETMPILKNRSSPKTVSNKKKYSSKARELVKGFWDILERLQEEGDYSFPLTTAARTKKYFAELNVAEVIVEKFSARADYFEAVINFALEDKYHGKRFESLSQFNRWENDYRRKLGENV